MSTHSLGEHICHIFHLKYLLNQETYATCAALYVQQDNRIRAPERAFSLLMYLKK